MIELSKAFCKKLKETIAQAMEENNNELVLELQNILTSQQTLMQTPLSIPQEHGLSSPTLKLEDEKKTEARKQFFPDCPDSPKTKTDHRSPYATKGPAFFTALPDKKTNEIALREVKIYIINLIVNSFENSLGSLGIPLVLINATPETVFTQIKLAGGSSLGSDFVHQLQRLNTLPPSARNKKLISDFLTKYKGCERVAEIVTNLTSGHCLLDDLSGVTTLEQLTKWNELLIQALTMEEPSPDFSSPHENLLKLLTNPATSLVEIYVRQVKELESRDDTLYIQPEDSGSLSLTKPTSTPL